MIRPLILAALAAAAMSACTADTCYTDREAIRQDCIELRLTDPDADCRCEAAKSEGVSYSAPPPRPEPEKPIYEPPGEGKDRPGYGDWEAAGKPKRP